MLPGRALGWSSRAIRLLASPTFAGLAARSRIELVRGSAITTMRWPGSMAPPAPPGCSSRRCTATAMSVATAYCTGMTSTSRVDGLSSVATMRAIRSTFAA